MLTKQQSKLLRFLVDRQQRGTPPSYDEMQVFMGLASKSGIHRMIKALEGRGFVRRVIVNVKGAARSIEVIRTGWKNVCPHCNGTGHLDAAPLDKRVA